MTVIVSSTPNWKCFVTSSSQELEQAGTDEDNSRWIQRAYAWFFERLPKSLQAKYSRPLAVESVLPPPERFMPFPAALNDDSGDFEAGTLGFVAIDSNGSQDAETATGQNDGLHQAAYKAARYVYEVFRQFDRSVGYPRVELQVMENADGGSISLSAMIAAMCRILKIEIPDTLIATGCFEEDKRPTLLPVAEETLAQKITAAVRYGYRTFVLVEGQKGTWQQQSLDPEELKRALMQEGILPLDAELEFLTVPTHPLLALMQVLCKLPASEEDTLAEFLMTLSFLGPWQNSQFMQLLESQLSNASRLVRHVAAILRSRCELHQGNSQQAEAFRWQAPPLEPTDFPFGPFGTYLKYEEPASRVIQKLDLGMWEDSDPDCQLMLRILERQKGCIQDRVADIEDIRIALASANTNARRLFFWGRLRKDPNLLRKAWEELTAFQSYWDAIFEYTQKQGRVQETFQRQWDQCLECQEDYWHLTGELLPEDGLPKTFELPDGSSGYRLMAWLRWMLVHRRPEEISLTQYLPLVDGCFQKWGGYPNFLPYEKILIYGLGTEQERAHARAQLAAAPHLSKASDIMAILAMRTAWILQDESKLQTAYQSVPASLKWLADELLQDLDNIVFRCPY